MPNTLSPIAELGIGIGMFVVLLSFVLGTVWLIQTGRLITKATIEREAKQWEVRMEEIRTTYEAILTQERNISSKYLSALEREQRIADSHAESLDRLTDEIVKVTVFIDAMRSVAEGGGE